jgi:ATP-binding cassette subfamily B multidrug efflux pump
MFGGGGGHGPRGFMAQEAFKPKRTSETLIRFGKYMLPWWPALVVAVFLVVISTWAQVTTPEVTGQLTDCFLSPAASSALGQSSFTGLSNSSASNCWLIAGKTPSGFSQRVVKSLFLAGGFSAPSANPSDAERLAGLGRLTLIMVGLYVVGGLLTGLTFYAMTYAGQHVLRQMRVEVFAHLHRLHLGYYAEHEAGDLMSRITNDTEAIGQAVNFALVNVASGALLLVWIAWNMFTKSWSFALLSIAVSPLMVVATLWFSSQARKAFRTSRKELGNVNAELQESIAAVREVQAFNRSEENIEQFKITNAANRDANVRAVSFTAALSPTLEALGYLSLAVVTVTGGLALLNGSQMLGTEISIGLVITFLMYVQRFNQPIQQISVLWTNIQNAIAGAERIFGLLDEVPEVQDATDARALPQIIGKVEFANVSAAYKVDDLVLCNVSFTAAAGQTIAIVGPTGAGKTTIINLIPRFYDVTGGAVLIDDIDVRTVTARSLREQIGIVLQDTFLFSTSVMENIRFGRPDATDEEVRAAAQLAHADTFIDRLPDKYQTVLGERGSGLSQGQRQLLAIARAALADPRILILDEATSSVDTRTERLIQKALENLLKGRTSFVIAHRLSTIRNADLLLVLDNGEIVERGTHDELLDKRGFYYDLYMKQFRKETPEEAARLFDSDGRRPNALAPAD